MTNTAFSTSEWEADSARSTCSLCEAPFTLTVRRHHCRRCARLVCATCSPSRTVVSGVNDEKPCRVCTVCDEMISLIDEVPRLLRPAANNERKLSHDDAYKLRCWSSRLDYLAKKSQNHERMLRGNGGAALVLLIGADAADASTRHGAISAATTLLSASEHNWQPLLRAELVDALCLCLEQFGTADSSSLSMERMRHSVGVVAPRARETPPPDTSSHARHRSTGSMTTLPDIAERRSNAPEFGDEADINQVRVGALNALRILMDTRDEHLGQLVDQSALAHRTLPPTARIAHGEAHVRLAAADYLISIVRSGATLDENETRVALRPFIMMALDEAHTAQIRAAKAFAAFIDTDHRHAANVDQAASALSPLLRDGGLLPLLTLCTSTFDDVVHTACEAFVALCEHGTCTSVEKLLAHGGTQLLATLLRTADSDVCGRALHALHTVLRTNVDLARLLAPNVTDIFDALVAVCAADLRRPSDVTRERSLEAHVQASCLDCICILLGCDKSSLLPTTLVSSIRADCADLRCMRLLRRWLQRAGRSDSNDRLYAYLITEK